MGPPRFLGEPCTPAIALRPRGNLRARPLQRIDVASALTTACGFPDIMPFEAQSRGPRARCLRFAARVTPPPRKTRYRRVVAFAGQDFHLLAHHGRFP